MRRVVGKVWHDGVTYTNLKPRMEVTIHPGWYAVIEDDDEPEPETNEEGDEDE